MYEKILIKIVVTVEHSFIITIINANFGKCKACVIILKNCGINKVLIQNKRYRFTKLAMCNIFKINFHRGLTT